MPEVPENMQDNLAHLEQEASNGYRVSQYSNGTQGTYGGRSPSQYSQNYNRGSVAGQPNKSGRDLSGGSNGYGSAVPLQLPEAPNFSPFPVLHNPAPNVPPTDEQREMHLESARLPVLASQDPENQLTWAQDALSYVEIAVQNEARVAVIQGPRPRTPRIEHQLKEDAMNVVNFLADQGHPKGEFIRGMWWEFGKFGYRVDKKEAFHCYTRAAEKGNGRAKYRIGMQFESSNEPLKAIKYYREGVEMDDSASAYRLGMMTLLGQHGQPQDYDRGLQLVYLSAINADENAPQGAYVFGLLQARELPQVNIPEQFLPMNLQDAKMYVEKAAFLGFAKAQAKMGSAYELCQLGCDFDPALSMHYNALAARQGEADAEMAISKWFLCGHEGVFEKSEELAYTYAQRAAQSELPTAEFALGYFHEIGIYVPVDLTAARKWYEKAAADGNKDAASRIDGLSRSQTLSRKDHENVAISRIKSQYGSRRQRGRQTQPPLPSLPQVQETIEMPDMSRLSMSSAPPRPATAMPYPNSAGPNGRPPLTSGGFSNPNLRPASAFGINPNIRPASAQTTGGIPGRPQLYTDQPRPYSSVDTGYGRGHTPSPLGPSKYRTGPLSPTSPTTAGQFDTTSSTPLKLDIGYTAPLDPSGADRKRRPQGPTGRPIPNPKPATPAPAGRGGPNSGNQTKTSQYPPDRSSGRMSAPPASKPPPPRTDNRTTSMASNTKPPASSTSKPTTSKPAASKPAAATARLPGKGPKTFDEMGVPAAKQSDCVSRDYENPLPKTRLTIVACDVIPIQKSSCAYLATGVESVRHKCCISEFKRVIISVAYPREKMSG